MVVFFQNISFILWLSFILYFHLNFSLFILSLVSYIFYLIIHGYFLSFIHHRHRRRLM